MKKMLLAAILCLLLALVCSAAGGAEANAVPIALDVEVEAQITIPQEYAMFSFTPEESAMYNLRSNCEAEVVAVVFDDNMAPLERFCGYETTNEYGGFSMTCRLEADEKYYFGVGYYDLDRTGVIPVKLTKQNSLCLNPSYNKVELSDYGESRMLSVYPVRDDGTMTFQWYTVDGDQETALAGQTGPHYVIPCATEEAVYKCVVAQGGRTGEIFYNVCLMKHFWLDPDGRSEFRLQPNTPAAGPVVFKTKVNMLYGEAVYQWYEVVGDEYREIEGETGANYTPDAALTNGMQSHFFVCKATWMVNGEAMEEEEAEFSILVENDLEVRGFDDTWDEKVFQPGKPLKLAVEASCDAGADTLSYQWQKAVTDEHDQWVTTPIENATQPTFTVTQMAKATEYYGCRVTDDFGNFKIVEYCVTRGEGTATGSLTAHAQNDEAFVEVNSDGMATMTVEASSDEGELVYRWYQRVYEVINQQDECYVRLADADGASLTVQVIGSQVRYFCLVSDGVSEKRVDFAADDPEYRGFDLEIVPGGEFQEVERGGSLTLSAKATPETNVRYYWYREGHIYEPSTLIATGDTLVLNDVQEEGYYYCVAQDGYQISREDIYVSFSESESDPYGRIYLAGATEEEIEEARGCDITLGSGDDVKDVVMQVVSPGEGLTFQWYRDVFHSSRFDDSYSTYTPLPGATGPTLTVENVDEECTYECRVFRNNTCENIHFNIYIDSGLAVTRLVNGEEPEGEITVAPHGSITLKAQATTNAGALSYHWTGHDETKDRTIDLEDVEGDTLTLTDFCGVADIRCNVSDSYNDQEIEFTIKTDNGFSAEQEPYEDEYGFGDSATLKVNVNCLDDSRLRFRWYRLEPERGWGAKTRIEGANGDTLQIDNLTESVRYECRVFDGMSMSSYERTDIMYDLRVDSGLRAWYANGQSNYYVDLGESQELAVEATTHLENATITYRWQRYDNVNGEYVDIPDAVGASYTEQNIRKETDIQCVVSDGTTNEYVYFYIHVNSHLDANFDWTNSVTTVDPGETAVFAITAQSLVPQDQIAYRWYLIPLNEQTGEWDYENRVELEGETGATLTVENVQRSGRYMCVVTDGVNEITLTTDLSIRNYNDMNSWFDRYDYYYVPEGESLVLKASECGGSVDPYTYKWYQNGELIEGANDNEFTLTATEPGRIRWVAQDEYGNTKMKDITYFAGAPVQIAEGEGETVAIDGSDRTRVFAFTPQATGSYTFTVSESDEYYAILVMFNEDNAAESSFNSGETFQLSAGRTYYTAVYVTWLGVDEDEYTFTIEQQGGDYEELDPVSLTLPYSPDTLFALPGPDDYEDCSTSNPNVISLDYGTESPNVFTDGIGSADVTVWYGDETMRTFHITVIDGTVIVAPAMLDTIEESAFEGDTAVSVVKLGEAVNAIGEYAFRNSGIQVFWIASDDAQIAGNAFDGASPTMIIPFGADDLKDYAEDHEIPYVFTSR